MWKRLALVLLLLALPASAQAATCSTSWDVAKTWANAEVLTHTDLNAEFNNTNTLGANCASVMSDHKHTGTRTTQMDAHASLTATSIHASLIVTDTAAHGLTLVVKGDGTADWEVANAHSALATKSITAGLVTTGTATHGQALVVQGDGTADWGAANKDSVAITFIINGGTSVITPGAKGFLEVPFGCTIDQVLVMANQSGSL
ncbi:hypothetical protein LCGC14_2044530, partial [marine sediment metagenome]